MPRQENFVEEENGDVVNRVGELRLEQRLRHSWLEDLAHLHPQALRSLFRITFKDTACGDTTDASNSKDIIRCIRDRGLSQYSLESFIGECFGVYRGNYGCDQAACDIVRNGYRKHEILELLDEHWKQNVPARTRALYNPNEESLFESEDFFTTDAEAEKIRQAKQLCRELQLNFANCVTSGDYLEILKKWRKKPFWWASYASHDALVALLEKIFPTSGLNNPSTTRHMIAYLHDFDTLENVTKAQLEGICKLSDISCRIKIETLESRLVKYFQTRRHDCFKNALFAAIADDDVECLCDVMSRYDEKIDDVFDEDGLTPMVRAANENATNVVETLRDAVPMDHQDEEGDTHLHKAVKFNKPTAVFVLISYMASLNQKNGNGETPLIIAVKHGYVEIVQKLLNEKETNVNLGDNSGLTPLHHAMKRQQQKIYAELMKYPERVRVNAPDNEGSTPLMFAAESNLEDVVIDLIANHGATYDAKNKLGLTPLLFAAQGDADEKVITTLLNEYHLDGAGVNAVNNRNIGAIHVAAFHGSCKAINVLKKLKADFGEKCDGSELIKMFPGENSRGDGCCEWTALHCASYADQADTIHALLRDLDDSAALDAINAKDETGRTPLHWAAKRNAKRAVQVLCGSNALADIKNKFAQTPLEEASAEDVKAILARHYADSVNKSQDSARYWWLDSLAYFHREAMEKLVRISNGVDEGDEEPLGDTNVEEGIKSIRQRGLTKRDLQAFIGQCFKPGNKYISDREAHEIVRTGMRKSDLIERLDEHFERPEERQNLNQELVHIYDPSERDIEKFFRNIDSEDEKIRKAKKLCALLHLQSSDVLASSDMSSCVQELKKWRKTPFWWASFVKELTSLQAIWDEILSLKIHKERPDTRSELIADLHALSLNDVTNDELRWICGLRIFENVTPWIQVQTLEKRIEEYFRRKPKPSQEEMSANADDPSQEEMSANADDPSQEEMSANADDPPQEEMSANTDDPPQEEMSANADAGSHSSSTKPRELSHDAIQELRNIRISFRQWRLDVYPRLGKLGTDVVNNVLDALNKSYDANGMKQGEEIDKMKQKVQSFYELPLKQTLKEFPCFLISENENVFTQKNSPDALTETFECSCRQANVAIHTLIKEYSDQVKKHISEGHHDSDYFITTQDGKIQTWLSEGTFAQQTMLPHIQKLCKKVSGDSEGIFEIKCFREYSPEFVACSRSLSQFEPSEEFWGKTTHGKDRADFNGTITCLQSGHIFRFAIELKYGVKPGVKMGNGQCGQYLMPHKKAYDFAVLLVITSNRSAFEDVEEKPRFLHSIILEKEDQHDEFCKKTRDDKNRDRDGDRDNTTDPSSNYLNRSASGEIPSDVNTKFYEDEVDDDGIANEHDDNDFIATEDGTQDPDENEIRLAKQLDNKNAQETYEHLKRDYGESFSWYTRFKYANVETGEYTSAYNRVFFEKEKYVEDLLELFSDSNENLRKNPSLSPDFAAWRLAGGATQVGKTWFKVLAALCGKQQGTATIVITSTVVGAKDLTKKIGTELYKVEKDIEVAYFTSKWDGKSRDFQHPSGLICHSRKQMLRGVFESSGCIVLANSHNQINDIKTIIRDHAEACGVDKKPRMHYALIVDEADEMIREDMERAPKYVQALNSFRKLYQCENESGAYIGPLVNISISATLLPVYLDLRDIKPRDWDKKHLRVYLAIAPKEQYVGLPDFQPLLDENEKPMYLDDGELQAQNLFYSDRVAHFYKDAHNNSDSLVLDITCSTVTSNRTVTDHKSKHGCGNWCSNMHHKAALVQEQFENFVVCTYYGRAHCVKYEAADKFHVEIERDKYQESGHPCPHRHKLIGATLDDILERHGTRPIAIFGYAMMTRGISFRPANSQKRDRVPTHIILYMGRGMSIDKVVQALGRATFLGENRTVKVLARKADLECAKLYAPLMQRISEEIERGDTLSNILRREGPLSKDTEEGTGKPKWRAFLQVGRSIGIGRRNTYEIIDNLGLTPPVKREKYEMILKLKCMLKPSRIGKATKADIDEEMLATHGEDGRIADHEWRDFMLPQTDFFIRAGGHLQLSESYMRDCEAICEKTLRERFKELLHQREDASNKDVLLMKKDEFSSWLTTKGIKYEDMIGDQKPEIRRKDLIELFEKIPNVDETYLCDRLWKGIVKNDDEKMSKRGSLIVYTALCIFEKKSQEEVLGNLTSDPLWKDHKAASEHFRNYLHDCQRDDASRTNATANANDVLSPMILGSPEEDVDAENRHTPIPGVIDLTVDHA